MSFYVLGDQFVTLGFSKTPSRENDCFFFQRRRWGERSWVTRIGKGFRKVLDEEEAGSLIVGE
jgi:hypothetical protein